MRTRFLVCWVALAALACRTAPRAAPAAPGADAADAGPGEPDAGPLAPAPPAQPGTVIAVVDGAAVLALSAPGFAALPREQRVVAYWLSQAMLEGEGIAVDQGSRQALGILRLFRGILSRPQVVPPVILPRVRAFARVLYLHRGLYDYETGKKVAPDFSAAELRLAALSAQAAGADLGFAGAQVEFGLRALDGPLFDARQDPLRTSRGDLAPRGSAVNFYDGVQPRDLEALAERSPSISRLGKLSGRVVEEVPRAGGLYGERLVRVALALEQAALIAPPAQRAAIAALALSLRSGEPVEQRAAARAFLDWPGPVQGRLGFVDPSADPRGRKLLFGGVLGAADGQRGEALRALAQAAPRLEEKLPYAPGERRSFAKASEATSLELAAVSGALRPLRDFGFTVSSDAGARSLLFPGAAAAQLQAFTAPAFAVLAEPAAARSLSECLPELAFAHLALREIIGRPARRVAPEASAKVQGDLRVLEEARADLVAHALFKDPLLREVGLFPDARCQELWPRYAATSFFAAAAHLPAGDRLSDDHARAVQLQIWWFTGKGALAERTEGGKRFLAVPDPERLRAAAVELLQLLQQLESSGDAARLHDLLEAHASRLDGAFRDEVLARLQKAGLPRRVAVLGAELRPVLSSGKVVDALAVPVEDLDAQLLRDWEHL